MGWLDIPEVKGRFNPQAELPYGLKLDDIKKAMEFTYEVLNTLNKALVEKVGLRMEEIMRPNSFPDLLSTLLVAGISTYSSTLTQNRKHDGYPDLLPLDHEEYKKEDYFVHHGKEGIEVKASKQGYGWQGHNPEEGWLMVFRYEVDRETAPKEKRSPTRFVEVLAAKLEKSDWSFSGRGPGSRRTITASVNKSGVKKMRRNWIYREC